MVFRVVKLGFQGSQNGFRVVKLSFQVGKTEFSGWYNRVFRRVNLGFQGSKTGFSNIIICLFPDIPIYFPGAP